MTGNFPHYLRQYYTVHQYNRIEHRRGVIERQRHEKSVKTSADDIIDDRNLWGKIPICDKFVGI